MHHLNNKEVYSYDIIKFKNLDIYESFYRLTFRYNGKLHCSLFKTESDVREFIDRYYIAWQSNSTAVDTPPEQYVD